jgi:hypothetical protein
MFLGKFSHIETIQVPLSFGGKLRACSLVFLFLVKSIKIEKYG